MRIYKKTVLSEEIPEVGTVITETTYDYYLMDAMGKTVAIFHSKNNDQGLVESWEYYASGAERECRLVPSSAQVPGANTSNTNVKFQKDQASFYLYDHLGNTRVTYTPTITTTLNQTQVLNNTFTGTTDGWSATSNTTISSVNNQLEVLTSNTTASVSKVIPFSANTDYSLSIDVAIESVGVPTDEPNVTLTIISGGNSVAQTTLVDGNNTLTFTSLTQPPTVAFVQINGTLTNYRVHLDNFIVSEVDATTEYSNIINSVIDYFPYGKVLREFVNGDHERYLTTQHERDQETELDYRGARYYDGGVGRFLSTDPWQDKYPAWSTYNYVMGNPLIFTDPTGKGVTDNWILYDDGTASVQKTDDKSDNFKYEDADGNVTDLGTYEKADDGLLTVPRGNTEIYMNNGKVSESYINSKTWAGILGAAFEYNQITGLKIQINQLNNKNGGHSSRLSGEGACADIRYANIKGNVNESVWTNKPNFDRNNSQVLANSFYKFGFNRPFNILTENAAGNGPELSNTYFVDGSKTNPPFHHKHHMHLQHINIKLIQVFEEVKVVSPKK